MPFGVAQPIGSLESAVNDADPTVTADQLELYFSSGIALAAWAAPTSTSRRARPPPIRGVRRWRSPSCRRRATTTPEVSPDGLTLWQTTVRGSSKNRVFVAVRADRASAWGTPTLVAELTSNM